MIREGSRLEKSANLIQLLYHFFGSKVKKKNKRFGPFQEGGFSSPC